MLTHLHEQTLVISIGTLNNRMSLYNTNTNTNERVNKLLQMHANDAEEIPCITAGNICALVGLKSTRTGDTLIQFNDSRKSLRLPSIEIPAPVFVCAVEPATVSDEKLLQEALENVLREDQSMSPQCFNIAVRFPAYHEFRKLTYCSNNIPKHFMDLHFCVSFSSSLYASSMLLLSLKI